MADFRYSLNASTIRPTAILDKIRIAGEVGYEGIELWHDDIDAFVSSGGAVKQIRAALEEYQLSVPTTIYLGNWFDASEAEFEGVFRECCRRMRIAADLSASFVIAGPPAGVADYDVGAQHYRRLLEFGATIGVTPAMEFLGFVEQLNTIEDALEVIRRSQHELACTVLDPFHIQRGGGSVESIGKLTGNQVAIAHFMDTVNDPPREAQHDPHRVMPGDGVFDLRRYLELLRQIGYSGFLSLELFREDLWDKDPREVAHVGLQKMKAIVEG